jgi:hypothetical protein
VLAFGQDLRKGLIVEFSAKKKSTWRTRKRISANAVFGPNLYKPTQVFVRPASGKPCSGPCRTDARVSHILGHQLSLSKPAQFYTGIINGPEHVLCPLWSTQDKRLPFLFFLLVTVVIHSALSKLYDAFEFGKAYA